MKYFIVLVALTLFPSCGGGDSEALRRDNSRLEQELAEVKAELGEVEKHGEEKVAGLQDKLDTCYGALMAAESRVTDVCDAFEERAKAQLGLKPVTATKGVMTPTPCDPELAVHVVKVEADRAFIGYQVGGSQRYSDALYFQGTHADRSALYVKEGLEYPVMLTVTGCEGEECGVACMQVRTGHLSCYGDNPILD